MNCSVRALELDDANYIVDYFLKADEEFLRHMGADKSKLPTRPAWLNTIKLDLHKTWTKKSSFYVIWFLNDQPIGHSNINNIRYGKSAEMHLHLWVKQRRKQGLGFIFLKKSIAMYFDKFNLETLICEPNSNNAPPNKTLKKLGFTFIKSYETLPSPLAYYQSVNRYELYPDNFRNLSK